jgi:hypothetical protein
MTRPEARRRHLQASMDASYTGLPGQAKEAHEETMRRLQRQHPGVEQEAIAGSDQDFDQPLSAGLREHQRHLRKQAGLEHAQVLAQRKAMRGGKKPTRPAPKARRGAVRAGAHAGRAYYRSRPARDTGIPGAITSTGSTVMQAIGIGIGLSLAYLVLSKRGSSAFSGVLNTLSTAMQVLIQPVDPLSYHPFATSSATSSATAGENTTPAFHSTKQTKTLNPKFGPAPGIGTVITPIGGQG